MKQFRTTGGFRLSANGTRAFGLRACCLILMLMPAALHAASNDFFASSLAEPARVRLETTPFPNGSELVTVFVALAPDPSPKYREMPVLSVLRDTLGGTDPETSRMRDVWLLTAGRPSALRRVESALPFLYLL